MRRQLIAGNWKMNGLLASRAEVVTVLRAVAARKPGIEVVICPPATLLHTLAPAVANTPVKLGAQTCHIAPSGPHTGDISAEMLKDAGASFIIVGHSERRAEHGESDAFVAAQTEAAWRAGLSAIICIGETGDERQRGETEDVLAYQIDNSIPKAAHPDTMVVAYEPVWAIGTGLTASSDDIEAAHAFIRAKLEARMKSAGRTIRILYGGSVKASNAKQILRLESVDGVLVGGASLKASDFLPIIEASPAF